MLSAAIEHTISAVTNQGDTILVVTPYFSAYEGVGILNKCNIKFIDTADNGFKVRPSDLEKALEENKDAKAILINYPNNPSGVSYTREEVKEIADVLGNMIFLYLVMKFMEILRITTNTHH